MGHRPFGEHALVRTQDFLPNPISYNGGTACLAWFRVQVQSAAKLAGALPPPLGPDRRDQLTMAGGRAILPPTSQRLRIDTTRASGMSDLTPMRFLLVFKPYFAGYL